MRHSLIFTLESSTKNTYRYMEVPPAGESKVVGPLYVQKQALSSPPPQEMQMILTATQGA